MGLFSGIFKPFTCKICGAKVGVISGFKLKDSSWLCSDCGKKCSPELTESEYARMTLENVQEALQLRQQRVDWYHTDFKPTVVFRQAGLRDNDLLAVDEEHGLWASLVRDEPEAFPISAVKKHALIFKTKGDESESSGSGAPWGGLVDFAVKTVTGSPELTRADFPRIPDEAVKEMNLWFYVDVPYMRRVKIPLVGSIYPKRMEIEMGYRRAEEILVYLEDLYNRMYPDDVANNPFDQRSILAENAMEGLNRLTEMLGGKR